MKYESYIFIIKWSLIAEIVDRGHVYPPMLQCIRMCQVHLLHAILSSERKEQQTKQ